MADIDLLNEVKHDIAEEKYQRIFLEHGKKLIVAGVAIVAFTGAYKLYDNSQTRKAQETGTLYMKALDTANQADYDAIIKAGHKGYSPLAGLTKAALLDNSKSTDEAIATLEKVAADSSYDRAFREMAMLNQAYLMIKAKKDKQQILALLDKVSQKDSVFSGTATEVKASYLLEQGDKKQALELYTKLASDNSIPATLQDRAKHVLATINQ